MKFFNPFPNNRYILGRYNYHDKDDKNNILCNILIAVFFPKQHLDFFMQKMQDMEKDMMAGLFTPIHDDSMTSFPFLFPDDFRISSLIWKDDKWRNIAFYAITPDYLVDEIDLIFKKNFVSQNKEETVKSVEAEVVSEEFTFDAPNAGNVVEEQLYDGSEEETFATTEELLELGAGTLSEREIEEEPEEIPEALEEATAVLEESQEIAEKKIIVLTIDSLIDEMEKTGKKFDFGGGFQLVKTPIKGEVAFAKIDKPDKIYSSEDENELKLFEEYTKKSGTIFLLLKHKNFIIVPESFGTNVMLFNHRIPIIDGLNVGMYVVKIPE